MSGYEGGNTCGFYTNKKQFSQSQSDPTVPDCQLLQVKVLLDLVWSIYNLHLSPYLRPGQSSCCNVWDRSCAGCSGVPEPGWSCDVITAVSCPGKKLLCLSCVSGRHLEQKWGFLPKVRRGLAALLPSAQHASSRAGQPSASLALILQHATFFQRRLF